MRKVLIYFAVKYKGDFDKIYEALGKKEPFDIEKYKRIEQLLEDTDIKCVTIVDANYPAKLKEINYPPFVLFYRGDLSLLNYETIGVIGDGHITDYGRSVTLTLCRDLVDNANPVFVTSKIGNSENVSVGDFVTYSGFRTVTILNRGLEMTDGGYKNLFITEYPYGVQGSKEKTLKSNRIVAGLSDKVYVTECARKGPSMTAVGFALEQNKDVWAIPCDIGSKLNGTNYLISLGANVYGGIYESK